MPVSPSEPREVLADHHRPRVLARNVTYTLAGIVAPAAVAVAAMPLLAAGLGTERLGVLTIAWAVIGYFSLLDLGVARALTNRVAAEWGKPTHQSLPGVVATAGALLLGIGAFGGMVTAVLSSWITRSVLDVSVALQPEVESSIRLLALAVPALAVSAGARGVLEARQRFGLVNAVRVPLGVMMYAGPLAMLSFTQSVLGCVGALVAVRLAAAVALMLMCVFELPALLEVRRLSRKAVRDLAATGAWMTLANVAGSLFTVLDRLVVGGVAGVAMLAYYSTPQEVVTKLSAIPGSISTVMFPAFSAHAGNHPSRLGATVSRSLHWTVVLLFPACAAIAMFAPELLTLWMGREFAAAGAGVARWICAGVLLNGLALTPFGLLQASGRARSVALVQCIELPIYAFVLWRATRTYGIQGGAAAWAGRAVVDAVILFALVRRRPAPATRMWPLLVAVTTLGVAAAWAMAIAESALARASWLGLLFTVFAGTCWRLADPHDTAWLKARALGLRGPRQVGPPC